MPFPVWDALYPQCQKFFSNRKRRKQAFILLAITLLSSICFFTAGCRNLDEGKKDEEKMNKSTNLLIMDRIHREKLQEIQFWTIKKGVADFYKTRDATPIEDYVRSRGYGIILGPRIDKYHTTTKGEKIHTLARFVIQSKHMFNQVWCLEQVEHKGDIYEYWVMQERTQKRSYNHSFRTCTFMITKAESLQDEREIIHSSEQFFSEYQVSPEFKITFPKKHIPRLQVWSFPESFQETDMEEIQQILSKLK